MSTLSEKLTNITENSLSKIFTLNRRKVNNLPTPTEPKFIIKYGPPASGKGSDAVKSLITSLGDPLNTYININVDDAVESTEMFTSSSRDLVNNIIKSKNLTNFNKFLNNATPEQVAKFSKIYTNIRFGKNNKGRTIGNKMDNLLMQALKAKKNITFETTGGTKFPYWLWTDLQHLITGYKIVIIFPIVPFEETWRRYKMRPIQTYIKGGGFRFGSSKNQLRDTYSNSYKNFIKFINQPNKRLLIDKIYIVPPAVNDHILIINKNTKNLNITVKMLTNISTVSHS